MTGPLETSVKGQFQQSASILHGKLHVLFTWAVEHNTADFLYGHSDNAVFICPEKIRIEVVCRICAITIKAKEKIIVKGKFHYSSKKFVKLIYRKFCEILEDTILLPPWT